MSELLFSPLRIGNIQLEHRVVMAPLTRMRAKDPGRAPYQLNAEYYGQRASAGGLIISEGSPVSDTAHGLPATPGIHSSEQVAGWQQVTDAVHRRGGRIFLQLWHVGRISHSSHLPAGSLPVAPSAIAPRGYAMSADFRPVPYEAPRALSTKEVVAVVQDFVQAAKNAMAAGFDGVEIHGANGYLIEQFLQEKTNQRTDEYGGSIEKRCRFAIEVAEAVTSVWGEGRVGIRLSPFGTANDSGENDPLPLYQHLIRRLASINLAYLHLVEPRASGAGQAEVNHKDVPSASELFRPLWPQVLIAAGNYTREGARAAVADGHADAIAFGRLFIANPDLPLRLRCNANLNRYDRDTFYGGHAAGYTDYPFLSHAEGLV
ncbi:alkene reductase [Paraburkholderia phenoliruptrix]|uniref:alkene reductase n=1 Tax=Paraburkholderia phenoliruptrix TaxID=252970 RepID=UPI001C4EEE06|nr:alkene reductase [Paraburkholderia phenoliruptrix]MBW0450934.1 alkene reductase [Paraburkholderia phenoliruptrix]MBW9096561.1 alkene reductase [Paraburkholderia phenoliruptrix]